MGISFSRYFFGVRDTDTEEIYKDSPEQTNRTEPFFGPADHHSDITLKLRAMNKENSKTRRTRVLSSATQIKKHKLNAIPIEPSTLSPASKVQDQSRRPFRLIQAPASTNSSSNIYIGIKNDESKSVVVEPKKDQKDSGIETELITETDSIDVDSLDEKKDWSGQDFYQRNCIGNGGFSTVYVASVKGYNGIRVALKYTNKKTLDYLNRHNPEKCAFLEECDLHISLKHENIVRALGFYKMVRNSVMIMEFCNKGDLQEYISGKTGPINRIRNQQFIKHIGKALEYLHMEAGIIHMDLKLENILVTESNVAKITDFGFAIKTRHVRQIHYKARGGTRWYKPPEQLELCQFDSTADIWALGCIAYEIMVMHHPFFNTDLMDHPSYDSKEEQPLALSRMKISNGFRHVELFAEEPTPFKEFINKVLVFSRCKRADAKQLLSLPWISQD